MQIDLPEQYHDIMAREAALSAWRGSRTSYMPEELPADLVPPSNEERSSAEFYRFIRWPHSPYFFYVDEKAKRVTTWMGDVLGTITYYGPEFRCGFGNSRRRYIKVRAVNGKLYQGQYCCTAGNYAYLRYAKRQ